MLPQTPYADVLCTNYIPTNTEIDEIHSLLTGPCAELERLDAEIAHLRAAIDDLSKERDRVSEFIYDHKALVSPARRLPSEMLEEIFWHCLPSAHNPVISVKEAPLLLGRVCSTWRATLLCAPRLWSSLHISTPMASDETALRLRIKQRYEGTATWLSRSGQLPLSISLGSSASRHSRQKYFSLTGGVLLTLLAPFSHRWREISVDITAISLSPLDALNHNDFPLLERLTLRRDQENRLPHSVETCLSSILQAPRLAKVTLANLSGPYHLLPLPRPQLTDLTIVHRMDDPTQFKLPEILRMLQQCPSLEKCTLGFKLWDAIDILAKTHIPALRTLRVYIGGESGDLSRFFKALVVPELRDLTIVTTTRQSDPQLGCPFLPIISKTDCLLEKFIISGVVMSHAGIVECLSRMRRLTTLWVEEIGFLRRGPPLIDDAVIQSFIMPWPADCLCPSLDTIVLRNCCLSEGRLIELLQSRSCPCPDGIAPLRVADVHYGRHHNAVDISSQLQTLHQQGMRVTVACDPPSLNSPNVESPWDGLLSSQITNVNDQVRDHFSL